MVRVEEHLLDRLVPIIKTSSPEQMQRLDNRLTAKGGKFAILARMLRGEYGTGREGINRASEKFEEYFMEHPEARPTD